LQSRIHNFKHLTPKWCPVPIRVHNEVAFAEPWHVSDAPRDFIDKLVGAVVGTEIVISRLSGKRKTSQNQPLQNQAGVIHGLQADGKAAALEMAALIEAAKSVQ
jgi:transcriptional regulator